jgi:hypothetical protein
MRSLPLAILALSFVPLAELGAQQNYEIQVYPSETAAKNTTFFELHSNFTAAGSTNDCTFSAANPCMYATDRQLHETLEITHGFSDIFEIGVYFFTSAGPGQPWQYVGSHLRPRIRAPEDWKLPVGLSLSTEFGFVKNGYDEGQWSMEFRPIIDKKMGAFYWSINPTLDWWFKGPEAGTGAKGVAVSPNVKVSWDFNDKITGGFEYYGFTGSLAEMAPIAQQQHVLYPAIDLNLSPDWEVNFGYGISLAGDGDHHIFKLILGRRLKF